MREALRKIVFICMPSNSLHAAQMSILALEGGWLSFVHLLILRHDLIYLIVWLCTPMLCEPSIILIAIPFIRLGASLVFQYKVLAMNTTNPKL